MKILNRPEDLLPGDLMFGPIHGLTGIGVGLAQLVLAIAEPGMIWKQGPSKWFRIRHAGIVVEASKNLPPGSVYRGTTYNTGVMTCPRLVQAMPGGAEEIDLRYDKWTSEYVYLRPAYDPGKPFEIGLENRGQGFKAARAARSFVGRPYDFETYGAIPLYRRGIRTDWVKRTISDRHTMMCSRLVDAALEDAGWHLFDDGRLPGNVTPSELYRQVIKMGPVAMSSIGNISTSLA